MMTDRIPGVRHHNATPLSGALFAPRGRERDKKWGREDSNLRRVSRQEKSGMQLYFLTTYASGSPKAPPSPAARAFHWV